MYDYGQTPYVNGYEPGSLVPLLYGGIFEDGDPYVPASDLPDEEFFNPRSHDPRLR